MELRQLRYFVAACEAGSLLKASGRLNVAQPALGQQVSALERTLGVQLLQRSSRGVRPTQAGQVFLDHARIVLADAERARLAVRESATVPAGVVALGMTTTVGLAATLPILRACRAQLPGVRLKVVEAYSGFLREHLQSGRLDLALLYDDGMNRGLNTYPLLDDRLVLVCGTAQPLPDTVCLATLARWPLVLPGREHGLRRIIDEACARQKLTLDIVAEIESLGSVKRAVQAGIGHTILPLGAVAEEVAAGDLRASPIDDTGMSRRVVCATNPARPGTAASAAVLQRILTLTREMVADGSWPAQWAGTRTGAMA